MHQTQSLSPYQLLNQSSYQPLLNIFYPYPQHKFSKQIPRTIQPHPQQQPIQTTLQLVHLIKQPIPPKPTPKPPHPPKPLFQP
ncbi:16S rRNA (cytosine(1402)-N(4))-methyltransferase, partial [Staphylococcus epidermidis]|uniref:16S rRNA (cytosine(1402)-N(4))-methyltransferase n=1 Tax=Staphylococcus epidermidis TaxID=1282 RepID=UPI0037D9C614